MSRYLVFSCGVVLVLLWQTALQPVVAFACPLRRGVVDFNCDGVIKVVAAGDSIVFGRGDLDNGNRGGWVRRLGPDLRIPAVKNLGVPGITTELLYQRLLRGLKNPQSSIAQRAADADIFIIGVGANDFYEHGDPSLAARNIKRIVGMVRKELSRGGKATPYVVVAKLTPTTRGFQRSFIENVNRLLARYRSVQLPSYLRFDLMDPAFVSFDGIHPISRGHEQLAQIAAAYIKTEAKTAMLASRNDRDQDGVYDAFERSRYNTDPTRADTDGDGLSDGREIFVVGTDPLNADTDGDGRPDGEEIQVGTNPLDPLS